MSYKYHSGLTLYPRVGTYVLWHPITVDFHYNLGLASITVPIYIAESAPPNLRGLLVSLNQAFISGGMFVSLLVSGAFCSVIVGWR